METISIPEIGNVVIDQAYRRWAPRAEAATAAYAALEQAVTRLEDTDTQEEYSAAFAAYQQAARDHDAASLAEHEAFEVVRIQGYPRIWAEVAEETAIPMSAMSEREQANQ